MAPAQQEPRTAVVTGARGFTGRRIARRLLDRGVAVRSLTDHPDRGRPLDGEVETHPYTFDEPDRLEAFLAGADVLFNTYWIRFEHGGSTFRDAVRNSRTLFLAAREAGLRRVVHVSITNPEPGSPLPYFRGKARVERELEDAGLPHVVLRPALLFGRGDILVNNLAWIFRRSPVFLVPGDGGYRVQPVHVDDLAAAAVRAWTGREGRVLDVVGPESYTFEEAARTVASALGRRVRIWHAPPRLCLAAARALGLLVGDVLLTRDELQGLTAGKLSVEEGSTADGRVEGATRFSRWLDRHAAELGTRYHSELERHFR